MKNNYKGFTLIELIAVITILELLILLAIPKITGLIGFNKIEARNKIDKSLISAAINYGVDNNLVGDSIIKIDDLCNGYIDCPIIDPVTNENLNVCVEKKVVDGIDKYEIVNDLTVCSPQTAAQTLIAKCDIDCNNGNPTIANGGLIKVTHDNGVVDYRYTGATVPNYATFNEETWRIIGIFTINGEQRIKLMRDEIIGNDIWYPNTTSGNTWTGSAVELGLNGNYLTSAGYLGSSLSSTAQNLIDNAEWYTAGIKPGKATIPAYIAERAGSTISRKVGLIYPSDYGYASSVCKDGEGVKYLAYYNDSTCTGSNWMYTNMASIKWWAMVPCLDTTYFAVYVNSNGSGGSDYVGGSHGVRPVVYLKPDVFISGDGTINNKYVFS